MTKEEALNKVRQMSLPKETMDILEALAPELRESEDERIRQALIEFLREAYSRGNAPEECAKWLVWLDRQKEQKPVDFPTTDEEVNKFLETHSKVEVPEKYKTPDFVFSKQEYESHPIISKDTTSVKPAEWSKEDEQRIAEIEFAIMQMNTKRVDTKDKCLAWLKSLHPQPHTVSIKNTTKFGNLEYERGVKDGIQSEKSRQWKPSKEQITALEL